MQTLAETGVPKLQKTGSSDKIIIANWKNNFPELAPWKNFPKFSSEVVICPRIMELQEVKQCVPNIELGLQDIYQEENDVKFVIIGHSDRRKTGDSNEIVNQKLRTVLNEGKLAILCIGETKEAKELGVSEEFIRKEIEEGLRDISSEKFNQIILAYEPVWAISTEIGGEADTPSHALEMIKFIKGLNSSFMYSRFIYGGSVNPENAESYLKNQDIEGALVGSASLEVEKFKKIIQIADGN